jgi:hypothetical protein
VRHAVTVIPAKAGIHEQRDIPGQAWTPAFAGVTGSLWFVYFSASR